MLTNTFKIALRTLRRHLGYTTINVLGLGVGLACCLVIYLFVQHERSYDRFHERADRIARVGMTWVFGETEMPVAPTATMPGPWLTEELPEVVNYVRFRQNETSVVRVGDESFRQENITYADSTLFDVFSFALLQGDARTVLTRPHTVVLTESVAQRYFGGADPVGQTIYVGDPSPRTATQVDDVPDAFEVTGVMADLPSNSHIQFELAASFASLPEAAEQSWNSSSYHTYLLLSEPGALASVQAATPGMLKDYFGGDANTPRLHVMPFTDVYLYGDLSGEWSPQGDIRRVTIFTAIALLILLIACVNYVNLATARAVDRAREVGVRKVLGAQQPGLVAQFIGEAVMITGLGILLALGFAAFLLPVFSEVGDTTLSWNVSGLPFAVLITWLGVSLLAGAYPAFMLARFRPVRVLKGTFRASRSGVVLRKGLVVFQFAVAVVLIVGTLVITTQMAFIQERDLGFNKEHVVVLPLDRTQRARAVTIKQALTTPSSVERVAATSHLPIAGVSGSTFRVSGTEDRQLLNTMRVDADFLPLMDIALIAGAPFAETDVREVYDEKAPCHIMINQAAADHFNWTPAEAVGQVIESPAVSAPTCTVKGVVEDFHFASLHQAVEPLVILSESAFYHLVVRTAPGDVRATLDDLEAAWASVVTDQPFTYEFLDQEFDAVYRSEQRTAQLFTGFAGLAIFVSCLGLFGLTAFSVVQRTREIGVRKVLGARAGQIVALLAREFLGLVAVAFVVAVPLAYLAAGQWLDGFAYRTALSPWLFAAAGALTLAIALATVSVHALRAATADPVQALRHE